MISFTQPIILIRVLVLLVLQMPTASALLAQATHLDWHMIDIGPIRQLVTNQGIYGGAVRYAEWGNDTNYDGQIDTEYPLGSFINYSGFYPNVGAKRKGVTHVTAGGPWLDFETMKEWYPTAEPWDSVWVVSNRETVDIPFWPNYTGVSDQDVLARYNDFGAASQAVQDHQPLGVEIIQVTYAWVSMEFLVHQFYIIPRQADLTDFYFGIWGEIQISEIGVANVHDSFVYFNDDLKLALIKEKGDGTTPIVGPEGFRVFPDDADSASVSITFSSQMNGLMALELPPQNDENRYRLMSNPGVYLDPDPIPAYGYFFYSLGPYKDVPVGDTVHVTLLQVLGVEEEGVFENYNRFITLRDQDYHLPAPPPPPIVNYKVANHRVILNWEPQPGDVNPETYFDEFRLDNEPEPFEGYRVYKSFVSKSGPWALLAEYDRDDDDIGWNFGLEYTYTDEGLLNNLEYFYSVVAFSKPDEVMGFPSLESSPIQSAISVAPGTPAPSTVGQVAVVPNPYRGDQKYYSYNPAWEKPSFGGTWIEQNRRIQFINLPSPSEIKIYTIAGKYVNTLHHDDSERGFQDWNLTSHVGQTISSGIYLYTVKDLDDGKVQVGKFVVIK